MVKDTNQDGQEKTSRRWFLRGVGATGLATGLAGCSGGGGGDGGNGNGTGGGNGSGTGGGGELRDSTLTLAQWAVPSDSQYNPYNAKNYSEPYRMLYDKFMRQNLETQEHHGYAISDWSFEDKTVSLTVRDGMKWHNGDDVTAADFVTQLKLDMYTGGSLSNYVDDIGNAITKADQKTVEINFASQISKEIVLSRLQSKRIAAKQSVYEKHLKAFENASSDEARSKAQSDLSKRAISDPIGSGPFQFEDADAQRALLKKFEDHPDADEINFPEVEYRYMPSNQKRWNALINGQTDGSATLFMPGNRLKQLPDSFQVGHIPDFSGLGIIFNHGNEHFGNRKVRQAVAHVIDRQAVAKNSAAGTDSKKAVKIPSGIAGQATNEPKKWLKNVAGKFNKYELNQDKAASLLQEAGYKKKGGTWQDSNGNAFKAPIKAPGGYSDWVTGAQTAVSNLQDFGIKSTLLTRKASVYWGKDYSNGNFTLALSGWAAGGLSYPYFDFDYLFRSGTAEDVWKVPSKFDVSPLDNPSESPKTYTPSSTVDELSRVSKEKATPLIQELAWVTNQTLPVLPLQEKFHQTFLTTDDWNVPPTDSPKIQVKWPTAWLPREGAWTAKQ